MMSWYIDPYTQTKYFEEPTTDNYQTVPYYRHHFARDYTIKNDTVYFKNVIMLNIEHYYNILSIVKKVVFNAQTNFFCPNGSFVLLPNITHVTFGEKFNQLFILTPYLVCVQFGTFFNQKLVLSSGIRRVYGKCFNQSIILGKNVNVISILHCSNTPFKLNKKMKYFVFGKVGLHTFCSGLSKNLKYFVTNSTFYEQHIFLPKHLVYLNFKPIAPTIIYPPYIKYLVIDNECMHRSTLDKISNDLHLSINILNNSKIVDNLPNGLKGINFNVAGVNWEKYLNVNMPNDFIVIP